MTAPSLAPNALQMLCISGGAVLGAVGLAIAYGLAPGFYLSACLFIGVLYTGSLIRYLQTRKSSWLGAGFFIGAVVLPGWGSAYHMDDWGFRFQGIGLGLFPTLVLAIVGHRWIRTMHQTSLDKTNSELATVEPAKVLRSGE